MPSLRRARRVSPPIGVVGVLLAGALLTGCATSEPVPDAGTGVVEGAPPATDLADLTGLGAEELIATLDELPVAQRPTGLMASVRPGEVVLTDAAGQEATVPMPKDRLYVSIAPYVSRTHECYFHSLTTCLGELRDQQVEVTVTDRSSGEVISEGTRRTFDNGFLGMWLPRGIEATVRIDHDGRTASTVVDTTGDDVPTCLTDLRLV